MILHIAQFVNGFLKKIFLMRNFIVTSLYMQTNFILLCVILCLTTIFTCAILFTGGINVKDRIKQIRKSKNMTQTEFGNVLHLSCSAVNGYEKGTRNPSASIIASICEKFHVREEWLRTGEGPMQEEMKPFDVLAARFGIAMVERDPLLVAMLTALLKSTPEELEIIYRKAKEVVAEVDRIKNETPEG
jgi:transcriptional regulator with XRE-family HTH domain